MNLLTFLLQATQRWSWVFPQERSLQRALTLAFGILCGVGKRTLTRAICFHGNTQKDWSADYKLRLDRAFAIMIRNTLGWGVRVAGFAWIAWAAPETRAARTPAAVLETADVAPIPGAELFTNASPPIVRILLAAKDVVRLNQDPRHYVPATVQEGTRVFERVGVHLKGSTGSFRSLGDRPSLTLNFARSDPAQRFHGLSRIHLNNSVEDPALFNEWLGSELFRGAGVPAPRVTHALVELNGRRLGLYVLKEGFWTEFLALHFRSPHGNLYDTGPGYDVDEDLTKDLGEGPDDGSDLRALADAVREPDLARRWQAFEKELEVERFVSFMAMEVICGHRDGYCLARNNFRVYHDPESGRLVFLPHGMDQLFGRPDATLRPSMAGRVARAFLEMPEGARRYAARVAELAGKLDVAALHRQADAFLARVRPVLSAGEARDLAQAVGALKERLCERQRSLAMQLQEPEPGPLAFERGQAPLGRWRAVDAPSGGLMDQGPSPEGRQALHILAGPTTSASWRTRVRLAPGRYRFHGSVRTQAVRGLGFGRNQGAGLRVVGATPSAPARFVGDRRWTELRQDFALDAEGEVEFCCELRAAAGEAWFDLETLRVSVQP